MEKSLKLKTRQKFSTLDIKYQAYHIQQIISGCVVNNIYDITAKSYLIKLGRAGQRENLFIDSGIRANLTDENLEIREKPNKFTQKLRKHIKGLFVDSVEQIGVERLFRIIFKGADKTLKSFEFHLYIELYAKGNIILTDAYDTVLACLREHKYTEEDVVSPQKPYPLDKAATYYLDKIDITEDILEDILQRTSSKKNKNTIILNKLVPFAHQLLCDLWLIKENIQPNDKYQNKNKEKLIEIAEQIKKIFSFTQIESKDQIAQNLKGYLYKKKDAKFSFEFSPIQLPFDKVFKDTIEEQEFSLFNQAIEQHFKQFNIVKTEEEVNEEIEREALKKYQKIEKDQHGRVNSIRNEIESLLQKAQLIEYHQKEVQGIIDIINELMQMGITNIMQDSIEQGKKEGDPLAQMIVKIKADTMKVIIELSELDEPEQKVQAQIDLKINAVQNAAVLYEKRKKLIEKEKKTLEAIEIALKKARNLAEKEIENKKLNFQKKNVLKERKVFWFEKFYWFLTSENYLVITARDAQQNEILIKRYMDKDDIVFHAHIQGSAFTIIKNNTKNPVSPLSINEVAVAALAHSKAWNLNVVVEVYWVYAHQVSKTAPTGLSLPSGSFMIYGKKNFINPYKLEMGFGLLFKVDQESAKKHIGERRIKVQGISHQSIQEKSDNNIDQKEDQKQQQPINSVQQIMNKEDENITQVKIQKKGKQIPVNKQKQKDKKKKNKKQQQKEKVEDEQPQQQQNKKNRKKNKKKEQKMKEYLEKFGGETKEEEEMRMKYLGYTKNQKFEQKKKEFDWNNEEAEIIQFDDDNSNQNKKNNENNEQDNQQNDEEKQKKNKQKEKFKDFLNIGVQDENISYDFFNVLTGKPLKDDNLISVYPICAPYNTLNDYKYKIKLLPGSTKRGKAYKLIQQIFQATQNMTKEEKELIKFIPENQAIMQITGTSKVQGPGINKIKRQNKNKRKKNKKKQLIFFSFASRYFRKKIDKLNNFENMHMHGQKKQSMKIRKRMFQIVFGSLGFLIFTHYYDSQIEFLYKDTKENEYLKNSLRDLKKGKVPVTSWLYIRFMQVIYGNVIREDGYVDFIREVHQDEDGENICLDWTSVHSKFDNKIQNNLPIVVVIPGLTGNAQCGYIREQIIGLKLEGFRCVAWSPRGSAIPCVKKIFDYQHLDQELNDVVDIIKKKYPQSNIYLLGFSLGASTAIKFMGGKNGHKVNGAVSISNPFDVYKAAENLNSWKNKVYINHMVKKLQQRTWLSEDFIKKLNEEKNAGIDFDKVKKVKTTFEFDKEFTFKLVPGFESSKDYYKHLSCLDQINNVKQRVLFIQSKNDPISTPDLIPRDIIKQKDNFFMTIVPKGAHVGYFTRMKAIRVSQKVECQSSCLILEFYRK